jgi:glycosyltransferase involved in cell wall biosynthesis
MRILYFGPIAPEGKGAIGGYEAANRKNITQLRKEKVDVEEFPNPIINKRLGALGKLAYLKLYILPLKLLRYRKKKEVIIHVTPLYRNLARPVVFTEWVARKLGIPVLLDIRAGSFIDIYTHNGDSQRKLMNRMLNLASRVTVEGSSYVSAIKDIAHYAGVMHYFPNLVDCSALKYTPRPSGQISIFYFGRITQAKGMDIILQTIKMLDDRFHLYLAGGIAPDIAPKELASDKITYLGMLTPDQLKRQMKKMHLFFFPTRHPGEGQSNSLIEAMSEGLIPVAADQGFCKEVIADCGVVLPQGSTAEDYKKVIESIAAGNMEEQGKRCVEHIKQCHNLETEIAKLIQIYKNII